MSDALQILALVVAVAVVAAASRRLGLSAPLVLVVVGLIASLVPGVPEYRIDPDVVLIGFLPPLLYAAAMRTSLVDVRANRPAIGMTGGRRGGVHDRAGRPGRVGGHSRGRLAGRSVRARCRGLPAGRRRRDDDRPQGGHAAPDRRDPRGREPAQRRDRAGGAAHHDPRRSWPRSASSGSPGGSCWPPAAAS